MRYVAIFVFCAFVVTVHSQSFRYWGDQYGPSAQMMAGAVVGGDAGAGSIYYNPAQISNITKSGFTINSDVVGFEFYRGSNAFGEDVDFRTSIFRVFPGFLSFEFKGKEDDRLNFAVSILTKEETRFDISNGVRFTQEVPDIGPVQYDATVDFFLDFTNIWLGFGSAFDLNEKLSVGASMFLTIKPGSYKYITDISTFALEPMDGPDRYAASNLTFRELNRTNEWGLRWKVGMQYRGSRIDLGINVTSPTLQLFSSGDISKRISYTNIPDGQGGLLPDFILVDQQFNVSNQYKDPVSIAVGGVYKFQDESNTRIYATVEYFGKLDPYQVFDTEERSNIGPAPLLDSIDTDDFLNVTNVADHVINVGVGFRSKASEHVDLYAGFRTDFSARKGLLKDQQGLSPDPGNFSVDVYHVTIGGIFNLKNGALFVGTQFTTGKGEGLRRLANLDDEIIEGEPPRLGLFENDVTLRYTGIALFFGFNIDI